MACASPRDACCRVVRGGRCAVGAARRHVHDELPTPAYVAALAPLAKKRALAQMRLSGAPIQTNLQRGAGAVPYSRRLCPGGCAATVDTEQHVLFECQATEAARARHRDALGLDACDMRCLMDKVYQQKDVGLVLDFVYEASNLIPARCFPCPCASDPDFQRRTARGRPVAPQNMLWSAVLAVCACVVW